MNNTLIGFGLGILSIILLPMYDDLITACKWRKMKARLEDLRLKEIELDQEDYKKYLKWKGTGL
jgi:hypothetical protein